MIFRTKYQGIDILEAFLQDAYYVFGLAHRVEMNSRDTMSDKVLALFCAPFRADSID